MSAKHMLLPRFPEDQGQASVVMLVHTGKISFLHIYHKIMTIHHRLLFFVSLVRYLRWLYEKGGVVLKREGPDEHHDR